MSSAICKAGVCFRTAWKTCFYPGIRPWKKALKSFAHRLDLFPALHPEAAYHHFSGSVLQPLPDSPDQRQPGFGSCLQVLCESGELVLTDFEPEPVYTFPNPLFRESIYRSILLSEKKRKHKSIAEHLEQQQSAKDLQALDSITHHYLQAQEEEKILFWCRIAAQTYYNAGAYDLCRFHYQALLAHSRDPQEQLSTRLSILGLDLLQAQNEAAKAGFTQLSGILETSGILRDRYVQLWVRYLNNTSQFAEIISFVEANLDRVEDAGIRNLLQLDYLEALQFGGEVQRFEALAPRLYAEFEASGEISCLSFLSVRWHSFI